MVRKKQASAPVQSSFGIVLAYVLLATAWILLSDQAISRLIHDPSLLAVAAAAKRWVFVAGTALFLFFLIHQKIKAVTTAQREWETMAGFLQLVNGCRSRADLIREAVTFFQAESGCAAVGIRLKQGEDFPYFEYRGFSREFIQAENNLCTRDEKGELCRDGSGQPIIDCMCGNVIRGCFDPAHSFFTSCGSFWSNGTTELLARTTAAELQGATRDRCNGEGYESVALIPLAVGAERLGLIQLNDREKGRFSARAIVQWERLAAHLAVALAKFQAEEALRLSEEHLRRAELEQEKIVRIESLGVLAGGIAHDFNNILTAVVGNISLARMKLGPDHRVDERLAACEQALCRATELTRRLLTFARGSEPAREAVDPAKLLREVVSLALHTSNCQGKLELPEGLWWLDADTGQVHQVFYNLVINAVQAMPSGGLLTVEGVNLNLPRGAEDGLKPGRYVRFTVADQGEGIAPKDLPRIFDPYFTTKANGSGLGLASVFSIVRRHGGTVDVASAPGAGTCFKLLLPAMADPSCAEAPVPDEARHCRPPSAAVPGVPILVMDDEEPIRSLLATMLKELGYQAVTCADGEAAVALYREHWDRRAPFAAVILDLTVPGGVGGREAAARLQAIDPAAILIMSSGYAADGAPTGPGVGSFHGVVAKPYNIQTLAKELSRLLGPAPPGALEPL